MNCWKKEDKSIRRPRTGVGGWERHERLHSGLDVRLSTFTLDWSALRWRVLVLGAMHTSVRWIGTRRDNLSAIACYGRGGI